MALPSTQRKPWQIRTPEEESILGFCDERAQGGRQRDAERRAEGGERQEEEEEEERKVLVKADDWFRESKAGDGWKLVALQDHEGEEVFCQVGIVLIPFFFFFLFLFQLV